MPRNSGKPLLLLDVDGVISLFGPGLDVRTGGSWLMVDGIAHFVSARAGEQLSGLREDFELVWCTGWEEKANDYLPRELGLPGPLPTISFDERPADLAHWKLGGIEAFAAPERPLAWVDDSHDAACREWARGRSAATLLVTVDPARGLTQAEADELREWAGANATGAPGG